MPRLCAWLSSIVCLLALPFFWLHPKVRGGFAARLGAVPTLPPHPRRVLMHGASAGDVLALVPTAMALRVRLPDAQVVVTTMTHSGLSVAHAHPQAFDGAHLAPLDVPWATARTLRRLGPTLLVLEYTELWPQLMAAARRRGVPIVWHNGRLAAGRLWRYRLLFALTGNLLQQLDRLLLREPAERARALALGAPPERLRVTGNTKFDGVAAAGTAATAASAAHLRRRLRGAPGERDDADGDRPPVWVAGSTHEGEEEGLLGQLVRLRARSPRLQLILAPRYPERGERVAQLAARRGLRVARLSQATPSDAASPPDVLVLDVMGALRAAYAVGDAAFVGGSFVPRGGQNILEPAAAGLPVLFGPHMHNFRDAMGALLGRGGIQVHSMDQLGEVLQRLLLEPGAARALGDVARAQVQHLGGAAERNAAELAHLLACGPGPAAARVRHAGPATRAP